MHMLEPSTTLIAVKKPCKSVHYVMYAQPQSTNTNPTKIRHMFNLATLKDDVARMYFSAAHHKQLKVLLCHMLSRK